MSSTANAEYLRALVETALAERDLELFDLQMGGGTVRVLIDREGGVDLEEVTAASQALNRVLDESDPLPGRYTLEVSSPGIERPLRLPTHFQRAVGEVVRIRTNPDVDGDRRVEGEILSADDQRVEVALKGDGGLTRSVAYTDIERARTVFDWDKAVALAAAKETAGAGDAAEESEVAVAANKSSDNTSNKKGRA